MAVKKNRVKAAKAAREVKAAKPSKAEAQANFVVPAPKDGPNLTLRMRSKTAIDSIKRAASKAKLSMNTWAVEVLDQASKAQIAA